jgi:uronate dehydrogenase
MPRTIERVLVTGAAGRLGLTLREGLRGEYALLRLSDVAEMAPAGPGEEVVRCDLADAAGVAALCDGIDAVVHMGGCPHEADWPTIHGANILGAINLWEGAKAHGVDRVVFASSNHAIGLYRREERLDHTTAARPDSRYGLSKAFGEDLAALYAFKWGVRGFCMRIGTCFPEPTDARALQTWLSRPDFVRLVRTGLSADYLFEIVYGVSANTTTWWDNRRAFELGFAPEDNAEDFREKVEGLGPADAIAGAFQGAGFASADFAGDPARVP